MITVKTDPTLKLPTIEVPIFSEDPSADPEGGHADASKQTKLMGVMTPLIKFDKYVIMFTDVEYFRLYISRSVPRMHCTIVDSLGFIGALSTPGSDNQIQMQIIPPFDNAYRKINLTMFITDSEIDGNRITFDAVYYIPKLWDNQMRAYGNITSYELFEQVANQLGLGFASNVAGTNDRRWIYNPNRHVVDLLNREIDFAGDSDAIGGKIYKWWIDYWNRINLVEIVSEYSSVETLPKIWVLGSRITEPMNEEEPEPTQTDPVICNIQELSTSGVYSKNMYPVNNPADYTDKNFEVYSMTDLDRYSTVVQDGDVYKQIIMDYEYGGEVFGDYDYLSQRMTNQMFTSKILAQYMSVEMPDAVLALPKGSKVNLNWYDYQYMHKDLLKDDDVKSNIPLEDIDDSDEEGAPVLNRMLSGQYYIYDEEIKFANGTWMSTLTLIRPASGVTKYADKIAEEEHGTDGSTE